MDNVPSGEVKAVEQKVSSSLPVKVVGLSEVPATVTPIDSHAAYEQLRRIFPDGSPGLITLLLSLVWVETGRGRLVQYNAGNLTAAESYTGLAWRPPWFFDNGQLTPKMKRLHDLMVAGKAPRAFRAYTTLEAGFNDFGNQLKRRFPEVLAAAETGDPEQFVQALRVKYSGDYGPDHVKTFASLQREFAPLTGVKPAAPVAKPKPKPSQGPGLVAALVIAKLFKFL